MEILGLSTSPSSGGAYALVLNDVESGRRLPIIIGTFEAQAIALELEHIRPPRPMTHDLIRNVIQQFNSQVKEVIISDLKEGTFFAKIIVQHDVTEIEIDARPSDAIAIAIRFDAPIYVIEKILQEAGIVAESEIIPKETATPEVSYSELSVPNTPSSYEERLEILHKSLSKAITDEDYEKAARLRDEINKLKG